MNTWAWAFDAAPDHCTAPSNRFACRESTDDPRPPAPVLRPSAVPRDAAWSEWRYFHYRSCDADVRAWSTYVPALPRAGRDYAAAIARQDRRQNAPCDAGAEPNTADP